jgi:hypothetical protein
MKTLLVSAAVLALFAVTPSFALTESTCAATWEKADANKDGNIDATEAEANKDELMKMGWDKMGQVPVSQTNYMTGCKASG